MTKWSVFEMRVLIAPDKFKGCLNAARVAGAMEAGLRRGRGDVDVDRCPMADGGEGIVEARSWLRGAGLFPAVLRGRFRI